jgi:glycosyltransferase involved in cell wall biosynthesis
MLERKNRILFLITELSYGGVQLEALEMMRSMDLDMYEVYFFAGNNGPLSSEYNSLSFVTGSIYCFKKNKYSIKEFLLLAKIINENKINTIISFSVKYSLLLSFLKYFNVKAFFIYRHSGILFNKKMSPIKYWMNKTIEYLNISSSDKTIAVCPNNANKLTVNFPKHKKKISWISTYYNFQKFCNRNKVLDRKFIVDRYSLQNDSFIICCPQSFVKEKNQIELVDIFIDFKQDCKNAFLFFCGDGIYIDVVKEYVRNRNLQNDVFFTGSVSNIEIFISGSDVICSTSYYMEGLPQICSQANFCSTPMVFYDWEGVSDELYHCKNGFLIDFGNKLEFQNKLKSIYNLDIEKGSYSNYNLPHDNSVLEQFHEILFFIPSN